MDELSSGNSGLGGQGGKLVWLGGSAAREYGPFIDLARGNATYDSMIAQGATAGKRFAGALGPVVDVGSMGYSAANNEWGNVGFKGIDATVSFGLAKAGGWGMAGAVLFNVAGGSKSLAKGAVAASSQYAVGSACGAFGSGHIW